MQPLSSVNLYKATPFERTHWKKISHPQSFHTFFYEDVLLYIYVNEKVVFNGINRITTQAVECVLFCSKEAFKKTIKLCFYFFPMAN